MDWKGLLTWSLAYQDGTVNKNLKPMTEEDRKFIEEAYESVCINEMKEIWKILDKLKTPETENISNEDIEARCDLIEDLIILIDGPENARNTVRAKRFIELFNYFFETKSKKIKLLMASLLGTMMQNDKYIQSAAIDLGIFKILEMINTTEDRELNSKYIYVLTGVLYGEYEKSKKIFLEEFEGLKLLHNLLIKNAPNQKNANITSFKRVLNIIKELTKIEEKDAENYKIRFLCFSKIKEINLHELLVELLGLMNYNTSDYIDMTKIIMEIFTNIIKVFDNPQVIYKSIQESNAKLNASELLNQEEIKEEKDFIIQILKTLKSEYISNENDDPVVLMLGIGEVSIEESGSKPSLHIELKK